MAKTDDNPLPCVIDGCTQSANIRGATKDLCRGHYYRKQRYGNPTEASHRRQKSICVAPGCGKPPVGHGWCTNHWWHWKRYGDGLRRKFGEIVDGKRVCSQCGVDTPLDEFGRSKSSYTGYTSYCKPCTRVRVAEWRSRNPGYIQPKTPVEKSRAWAKRWRQNNPDRAKANFMAYKARKRRAFVELVSSARVYERDEWVCGICRTPIDRLAEHPDLMSASVDHVIPISRGGKHSMANVQAAHLVCNLRKNNKLMAEISG